MSQGAAPRRHGARGGKPAVEKGSVFFSAIHQMLDVFKAYARAVPARAASSTAPVVVYFSPRRSKGAPGDHPREARGLVRHLLDPEQKAKDTASKFPKLHHEIDCPGGGCLRFSRGFDCGAEGEDLLCQVTPQSGGTRELFYTHGLGDDADLKAPLRVPAHVTLVHVAGEEDMNAHYTFYRFEKDTYRRHGPPWKRTADFTLDRLRADKDSIQEVQRYDGLLEFESLTLAADAHMRHMRGTVVAGGGDNETDSEDEPYADAEEWLLDVTEACLSTPQEGIEVAIMRARSGAFLITVSDIVADRGIFCTPSGVFRGDAWKWNREARLDEPSEDLDELHDELVELYERRAEPALQPRFAPHRSPKRRRTGESAATTGARRGGGRRSWFNLASLAIAALASATLL